MYSVNTWRAILCTDGNLSVIIYTMSGKEILQLGHIERLAPEVRANLMRYVTHLGLAVELVPAAEKDTPDVPLKPELATKPSSVSYLTLKGFEERHPIYPSATAGKTWNVFKHYLGIHDAAVQMKERGEEPRPSYLKALRLWNGIGLEIGKDESLPMRHYEQYDHITIPVPSVYVALKEQQLFALDGFGPATESFLVDFVNDSLQPEVPLQKTPVENIRALRDAFATGTQR